MEVGKEPATTFDGREEDRPSMPRFELFSFPPASVPVPPDPPPPPLPPLLVVVVVVVVATIEAEADVASIFMVIIKCFFWTCVRMSWTREKARSHTGHLVLPECRSRWRVSDIGCLKPFQHTLHRNWKAESAQTTEVRVILGLGARVNEEE